MPADSHGVSALWQEALAIAVIVVVALLLSRLLRRLVERRREAGHLTPVMAARLQRFRRWSMLGLTGLALMQALGLFGSAWSLISAGLAAVAIGFVAAWSVLSNATAALLVLTFRPFRIGDLVELLEASGASLGGRVLDMNLMYTTLRVEAQGEAAEGEPALLYVPNNLFFQKIVRARFARRYDSKAPFFPGPGE